MSVKNTVLRKTSECVSKKIPESTSEIFRIRIIIRPCRSFSDGDLGSDCIQSCGLPWCHYRAPWHGQRSWAKSSCSVVYGFFASNGYSVAATVGKQRLRVTWGDLGWLGVTWRQQQTSEWRIIITTIITIVITIIHHQQHNNNNHHNNNKNQPSWRSHFDWQELPNGLSSKARLGLQAAMCHRFYRHMGIPYQLCKIVFVFWLYI